MTSVDISAVADRLALHELISKSCQLFDLADLQAWGDCFTEDASWEFWGTDGVKGTDVSGRENLRAWLDKISKNYPNLALKHHINDITTELHGDEAEVRSYYWGMARGADGKASIRSGGRYLDQCRRGIDGIWRIARREAYRDMG